MGPLRLHLLLNAAVQHASLSTALLHQVFAQAWHQLYHCMPFTGCVVKYGTQDSHMLLIGKQ